jgi:hypothetical protein
MDQNGLSPTGVMDKAKPLEAQTWIHHLSS